MKYNYHTHTERCFHATGSDEAYVRSAIEAGFDEIGFADHTPWNFSDFTSHIRMHENQLSDYCDSVNALREKYKDKISIRLGLECEYFPQRMPWLEEAIRKHEIDYIILGHHFCGDEPTGKYNGGITTPEEIYSYRDEVLKAMETGLFSYVAHPDLFMRGYGEFDEHCEKVSRDIIAKAVETDTPLEFNLLGYSQIIRSGMAGYPHPKFWMIAAEMKPKAILGIDAHYPDAFNEYELYRRGCGQLDKYGLKAVDTIKFFR